MILTNPVINIDNVFQIFKHCSWIPGGYIVGDISARDFVGALHVNSVFRKEKFSINFLNLSEQLCDTLEQIFLQTGVNVFHTIQVISPGMTRIWDSSTVPSIQINQDVNRVRNQAYITGFDKKRIPGNPNRYNVTITCEES